jgi:thiol-disulfide isomerase/thioredoxin
MRPTSLAAVLVLSTCAIAQEPSKSVPSPVPPPPPVEKRLGIGDELPKGISLRTIAGKLQSFDELRGKVVVVHFWSTTCPYVAPAEPKLNALHAEFASKGVVVIGVATNANEIGTVPTAKDFEVKDAEHMPYAKFRAKAKESKIEHLIVVDPEGQLGRLLDAKTTPHCFVFDKDGKLQYTGALDDDMEGKKAKPAQFVRDVVVALLAGEKPGVQVTTPYGSRVRFAPKPTPKK